MVTAMGHNGPVHYDMRYFYLSVDMWWNSTLTLLDFLPTHLADLYPWWGVLGDLVRPTVYFCYLLNKALEISTLSLGLPRVKESCKGVAWTHTPPPLPYDFTLSIGLLSANEVLLSGISHPQPVFPLRKVYTEKVFVLLRTKRMQLHNNADTQTVKRSNR